jgi:thymidylate synthase (FAD)
MTEVATLERQHGKPLVEQVQAALVELAMKNGRIDLLDHGFVQLIDSMGDDLSVVRAARVSFDAAARAGDDRGKDKRLIGRLWKDRHTSPFEAVTFQFEVKAPIFVLRQWMRHRTWSYNEVSARYRELPEEFYVPCPEIIGVQSKDNKQGRDLTAPIDRAESEESARIIEDTCRLAFQRYKVLLERGVPREVARSVLPVATYSHMFASVNLLNLLRFLSLRSAADAQPEIQVYAVAMRDLVREIVPTCVEAWEANP